MTNTNTLGGYTNIAETLPDEAFLGNLLWFSISGADIHLENARQELTNRGLRLGTLRKNLRPVDAFKKACREINQKFPILDGVRRELMVRSLPDRAGGDEEARRFLMLERAVGTAGKRRQIFYEKVAEITFTRGRKRNGEYEGFGVETRRTNQATVELHDDEEAWISQGLSGFGSRFNHLCTHLDSHAVRTFVREYIYELGGVLVKENGGLYFVPQRNADEARKLGEWVKEIGSQFHTLPLLDLTDQREMLVQAFEEESVADLRRMSTTITEILKDPNRKIKTATFDEFGNKAAEVVARMNEYSQLLGEKMGVVGLEADMFKQQLLELVTRIDD